LGENGEKVSMKIRFSILIYLLLVAILNHDTKAQKNQSESKPTNIVEVAPSFDSNEYSDWQKLEIFHLVLYIPKDFTIEKRRGVDGVAWVYKNQNISFIIITGNVVDGPLITQTKLPSYKERRVIIDGIFTWMWFYEDRSEEYTNIGVSTFKDPVTKDYRYTMFLGSKNADGQKLAEKIFSSIKFNKNDQIKDKKVENKSLTPLNKQKKN